MKEKIKIFLQQNWFKIGSLVVIVIVVSGAFYWYEWRPSRIKHDCSWVKKHQDAIPAKPAVPGPSEEEIKALQEEINNCKATEHQMFACLNLEAKQSQQSQQAQQAQPSQPAKDWWERASKQEYDFCIHDKGL